MPLRNKCELETPKKQIQNEEKLKQFWSRVELTTSETTTPWNAIYEPGETVTIVTSEINSRITTSEEDKESMECWSYITIGRGFVLQL